MISTLRITQDGKKMRVLVDGEDVVSRMKKSWEGLDSDSRGVSFHDIVVDPKGLAAAGGERGETERALIFVCGCGVEGCAGVDAVDVTHDGYEIHWRIAPTALESAPLEFTFDPAQYGKALTAGIALIPSGPSRAARIARKRASEKTRKPKARAKTKAKAKAKVKAKAKKAKRKAGKR